MSTESTARVFVVCDAAEGSTFRDMLSEPLGVRALTLEVASAADGLMERCLQWRPDVVVVAATLGFVDTQQFIAGLRDRTQQGRLAVVLIGDIKGPVRTALDALDFAADRFIGRPLVGKSLRFAVTQCIESVHAEASQPKASQGGAVWPQGQGNLPRQATAGDAEHGYAGGGAAPREPTLILSGPPSQPYLDVPSAVPVALPARAVEATSQVRAAPASAHEVLELSERGLDEAWSEPSKVHPVSRRGTSQPDIDGLLEPDVLPPQVAPAPAPAPVPTPIGETVTSPIGRDFARELRTKMAQMAEKLFAQGAPPVAPAIAPAETDDLDLGEFTREPEIHGSSTEVISLNSPYIPVEPPPLPGELAHEPRAGWHETRDRQSVTYLELVRGQADAATLVARCHRMSLTGRLLLRAEKRDVTICFEQGRPVYATSNQPTDRMTEMLVREGKITRLQAKECETAMIKTGRRSGETLVDLGYLKRRELVPSVRRHLEDILSSAFAWPKGHYAIVVDETAVSERIRLSRVAAVLTIDGLRRKYALPQLAEVGVTGASVVELGERDKVSAVLLQLDLSAPERAAVLGLDALSELQLQARAAEIELQLLAAVTYGLSLFGLAIMRRGAFDDDPLEAGTGLVGETDLAIDRARILARLDLVKEADYFELIGVRKTATAYEIRRAYESARRDFAVDSFPTELRRELARELAEIAGVLTEAYGVLRDDVLRRAYLEHLQER